MQRSTFAAIVLLIPGLVLSGTTYYWYGGDTVSPFGTLERVTITGTREHEPSLVYDWTYRAPETSMQTLDREGESWLEAANRRTVACKREDMIKNAVVHAARTDPDLTSTFPSTINQLFQYVESAVRELTDVLSGGIKDPRYQGPGGKSSRSLWKARTIQQRRMPQRGPVRSTAHRGTSLAQQADHGR